MLYRSPRLPPRIDADADYRRLLADGAAFWPDDNADERYVRLWAQTLTRRAAADGLRAELVWYHQNDIAFWPSVELRARDGGALYDFRGYPPIQQQMIDVLRPRVEAEWGETLIRARCLSGSDA